MAAKRISDPACLPEGFSYRTEFLSLEEESNLLQEIGGLEFQVFDFHGYIAKRRIVEYGFEYDFSSRQAQTARPLPEFLAPFRERAAEWAGIHREEIIESVITEYIPGSPIGWHRDVPQFEMIIGISLKSSCRFRFKPYREKGKIVSVVLEPRSAYILRGPARWEFQHSIPAVTSLRYSITFRTWRQKAGLRSKRTALNSEPSSPGEMESKRERHSDSRQL
jgi:alkylated DNA repair dioxygenase AlkB